MLNLIETKEILNDFDILPRQSLGQNFLVSPEIINEIITLSNCDKEHTVIEIGPGLGALTENILQIGCQLFAYEIDHRLTNVLNLRLNKYKNFNLYEKDFLKVDLEKNFKEHDSIKVIGNLPYYITTGIVEKLICELFTCKSMTLMLQKEAAQRLTLKANHSRYGPTAILVSLYGKISNKIDVAAAHFYPRPKINSQVLVIEQNQQSIMHQGLKKNSNLSVASFRIFLNQSFSMRRKTLFNNLKNKLPITIPFNKIKEKLKEQDLDLNIRAQEIPPEKFWQLYESMANYINNNYGGK